MYEGAKGLLPVAGGVIVLPNTGGNTILTIASIVSITMAQPLCFQRSFVTWRKKPTPRLKLGEQSEGTACLLRSAGQPSFVFKREIIMKKIKPTVLLLIIGLILMLGGGIALTEIVRSRESNLVMAPRPARL